MPHWRTFWNFTHQTLAIWEESNHDLFQIIPNRGKQQTVTLLLESICTIPFQARASDVKMPKLRQYSSNHAIQCFGHVRLHHLGDMRSGGQESRLAFSGSSRYLFEYYQSWDIPATHADYPRNWSSESCPIQIWLARLSLWQDVDPVYPTTNCLCLSCCRINDPPSQRGTQVDNWGVPEMGDVLGGTGFIWKYPCSIMFRRYASTLQFHYDCQARNKVQREAFAKHMLIGMIRFWSCPVPVWDIDLSIISFTG